ncbi:MAG: glycoside hydrolase family 3 N-terminal domain-containing protein, partial [Alphaproteobacteria bacterium]
MASFNAVNKRPMHAHRGLIEGWLRGVCGFGGLVVADYTGVHELIAHGLGDRAAVAVLALLAGIDMDMIGEDYLECLEAAATRGLSRPESGLEASAAEIAAAVDRACRRVLDLKHAIGLFDDPFRYVDEARARRTTLAPAHRALARRAASAACVLLKNAGAVLPLAPGAHVALVGPRADDRSNLLGTWAVAGDPAEAATVREALAAMHGGQVACVKGANLVDDPEIAARLDVFGPTVNADPRPEAELLAEALAAAKAADVVVAVVGEAKEHSGESSS